MRHHHNPSLSFLLAGPATSYGVTVCSHLPKRYSVPPARWQASILLTVKLLSIPPSGSSLSQMVRTLLVCQLFPLTYLFSFVRPAVRIHSHIGNRFHKWLLVLFFLFFSLCLRSSPKSCSLMLALCECSVLLPSSCWTTSNQFYYMSIMQKSPASCAF